MHRRVSALLLNGASTAMAVNGSVTPAEFSYTGRVSAARLITEVVFTLQSTGADLTAVAELRTLGAAGLLTNGIRLYVTQTGLAVPELDLLQAPVKQVLDFYRYGVVSGHTDGVAAGTDQVIVTLSWPQEAPLTLRVGTEDTLTCKIADNLSGLALFSAEVRGWSTS